MIMAPNQELVVIQNPEEDLTVKKKNLMRKTALKGKELEAVVAVVVQEVCLLTEEEEVASLDLVLGAE
jgi:hypothetical protein